MTERKPTTAPSQPKDGRHREQQPIWRNTRPRGNPALDRRDLDRSVERFEAVLGR